MKWELLRPSLVKPLSDISITWQCQLKILSLIDGRKNPFSDCTFEDVKEAQNRKNVPMVIRQGGRSEMKRPVMVSAQRMALAKDLRSRAATQVGLSPNERQKAKEYAANLERINVMIADQSKK